MDGSDMLPKIYAELQVVKQLLEEVLRRNGISKHSDSYGLPTMPPQVESPEEIFQALQILGIDQVDLNHITNVAGSLPSEGRGRAEQVVGTEKFKQWMLSDKHPGSQLRTMKLLVHGDCDSNDNISSFSVLCASLMRVLRSREDFISLVFFCGRHLREDENPGPLAMIRSLVGQLLQQNPSCPGGLSQDVSMHAVREGDIQELCRLFRCLIRQLRSTVTVFCLIDGIGLYERDQYRVEMEEILYFILDLTTDEGIDATIKLFMTSPQPTRYVRAVFQDVTSLLTMASVPDVAQGPNSIHFNKQLNDALESRFASE